MEATQLILLYDYYGDMLTQRQKECFELRYNQDLSLGEIGQELGISRQGVFDNLSRTEALLINMEKKTGCVSRDLRCRKAIERISQLADVLAGCSDNAVCAAAGEILELTKTLEE